eukprot:672478-Prorocentrum_minimum.AAC.1
MVNSDRKKHVKTFDIDALWKVTTAGTLSHSTTGEFDSPPPQRGFRASKGGPPSDSLSSEQCRHLQARQRILRLASEFC